MRHDGRPKFGRLPAAYGYPCPGARFAPFWTGHFSIRGRCYRKRLFRLPDSLGRHEAGVRNIFQAGFADVRTAAVEGGQAFFFQHFFVFYR